MPRLTHPLFWRDPRMPYLELRKVEDGRKVCYAPHSHEQWSLGAITDGESTFLYRDKCHPVQAGALVLMNPGWVHACNPIDNRPWGYWMMYVDTGWLTALRHEAGLLPRPDWQDIGTAILTDDHWYSGYCELAKTLLDPAQVLLDKQTRAVEYLSGLMHALADQPVQPMVQAPSRLHALAAFLDEHAADELSLETLCVQSGYSPGHLIRAFKQYFGLTPHAYLVNRRIQLGQSELKHGTAIADAALSTGFSDQAHFQRTFKRLVAATPNQYRRSVQDEVDTTGRKQDRQ